VWRYGLGWAKNCPKHVELIQKSVNFYCSIYLVILLYLSFTHLHGRLLLPVRKAVRKSYITVIIDHWTEVAVG